MLLSTLLDAFVDMLVPALARFGSKTRWVAVIEPDGVALHEVRTGRGALLSRPVLVGEDQRRLAERARGGAIELRLRPDQVLHRTLRLPQAGRDFVEQIIEHRLPRLTPWSPEKVLYGFRIAGEAEPDGLMSVEFAATSADLAATAVRRLRELGLEPTALGTAAESIDAPLRLDLFRGARSTARSRLRRATALASAAVASVLVPACLFSFWLAAAGEEHVQSVENRLIKARARLQAASGGGSERSRDRALLDAKRPESSVLVLVDRLGAAIPSDTFLRELEIDPEKVRLVGHSGNAPALIGLLEADAALAKVRFAAPVTRDSEDRDGFDIVAARVAPESGGAR
jgi:general secretion pathway protein L